MLAFVLTALALVSPALQLQPRTYVSPDGGWTLAVEPLTRDGTGAANYVLTGAGHEAYRREHPFALWDAFVTDDGRAGGYAYAGSGPDGLRGSVHVVVLSPQGGVVLDETHERTLSRHLHTPSDPRVRGLFAQPELGRFVVRVDDEDLNRSAESWWVYDVVDGRSLSRERPKLMLALEPAIRHAVAAKPVPGTPLVLVNWYRFASEVEPWSRGAVFQLLETTGAELHEVWRLELPHDYEGADQDAGNRLRHEIWRDGAILGTSARAFELRSVADAQRVRYAVSEAVEDWNVEELGREPYSTTARDVAPQASVFAPVRRSEVLLGGAGPPKGEIRDVLAFGFDPESRPRFARREEDGTTLVVLDPSGAVRSAVRVDERVGAALNLAWFPLASPRWVAATRKFREDGPVRAWMVTETSGTAEELAGFPAGGVERVLPLDERRLLVLRGEGGLLLYDVEKDRSEPFASDEFPAPVSSGGVTAHWGRSASDVTVTSDGRIVVMENAVDALHVLSPEGALLATLDLAELWGREPRYLSSLVAAPRGAVLVHDYNGVPPLWRTPLDGTAAVPLDARMASGETRDAYNRNARHAPDARLWTTDGHELVRLDESGIADLTMGEPPLVDRLETPGTGVIDTGFARILVQDERTKAFHVFDGGGKRVLVTRPRAAELDALRSLLEIGCTSSGGVRAGQSWYEDSYVLFAGSGDSEGIVALGAHNVCSVPGRDELWGELDGALVRILRGRVDLTRAKRADGLWWRQIEDVTVSTDGTIAVLDLPERNRPLARSPGRAVVARFDRDGNPLSQHELPEGVQPSRIAHAGPWVLVHHFGRDPWLLDVRSGSVIALELDAELGTDHRIDLGLAPAGDALWLLRAADRRLRTYSLPE